MAEIDTKRHEATLAALRSSHWATIVKAVPQAWLLTGRALEVARAAVTPPAESGQ
ncbi:MAG TPA: hypothetical protein VJ716_02830 [Gaiellaceae bacterium]|nr:hypothetical protein [Gaiellaceae bacterium]